MFLLAPPDAEAPKLILICQFSYSKTRKSHDATPTFRKNLLYFKRCVGAACDRARRISRRIRDECGVPLFLAGGLNANNIAEAITTVAPFGVDLCSSVRESGQLNAVKLAAFMEQIAAARPRRSTI